MLDQSTRLIVTNKLSLARRAAILRVLVEGNSVRSTARITGAAKATVLKLLVEVGEFCSIYQDHSLRNLTTKRIEADEIWAFVGAKVDRPMTKGVNVTYKEAPKAVKKVAEAPGLFDVSTAPAPKRKK